MFGLFKHKDTSENTINYSQAVIVNIMLDDGGMGSSSERNEISRLEKDLPSLLSPQDDLDGHEYGEGEAVIYMYGPSADTIFSSIEDRLRAMPFDHIDITLQYGRPEDPTTRDRKFTL